MNGPRDELFAGAGFAGDQHRRIGAGDPGHLREDGCQRGRAADNLFEHRGLVDFFSKGNVLLLQFVLVSFAILDVGTCDVPTNELSLVISERVVTKQKPAIRSVAATHALLHHQLVSGAAYQPAVKMCLDPVDVVRMKFSFMASLTPLVEADSIIAKRHSIRIQLLEPGAQYADELWREVQHLTELLLALAQRACEDLVLCDVDPGSDEPLEDSAVCRWRADAPDVTNRLVRTHDPLCKIESAMRPRKGPNFR